MIKIQEGRVESLRRVTRKAQADRKMHSTHMCIVRQRGNLDECNRVMQTRDNGRCNIYRLKLGPEDWESEWGGRAELFEEGNPIEPKRELRGGNEAEFEFTDGGLPPPPTEDG